MSPMGYYDPDLVTNSGGQKRPAWSIPTEGSLADEAMKTCPPKKYFAGTSKRTSDEYKKWDKIQQMAMGADDESYMFKMWVYECFRWPKSQNIRGTHVSFGMLTGSILDDNRRTEWIARNRVKVLAGRKNNVPTDVMEMDEDYMLKLKVLRENGNS